MSLPDRLADLRLKRDHILAEYEKLEQALEAGDISQPEHDYLIAYQYGGLTKQQQIERFDRKLAIFAGAVENTAPSSTEVLTEEPEPLPNEEQSFPLMTHEPRQKSWMPVAVIAAIFILGLGAFLFLDGGVTGFVVGGETVHAEPLLINTRYAETTTFNINVTNITGLTASGALRGYGSATITAELDGATLVLATLEQEQLFALTTDKREYALGETVTAVLEPTAEDVTYYAYIGEEAIPLIGDSFVPEQEGEYRLDAIITTGGDVVKESASFTVLAALALNTTNNTTNTTVNNTETNITTNTTEENATEDIALAIDDVPEPTVVMMEFSDACVETCSFEPYTGEVLITITPVRAELALDTLSLLVPRENSAPAQVTPLPDVTLEDGVAVIDLNDYFADPDSDALTFEMNNLVGVEETIDDGVLTLSGAIAGAYETYVYASDLHALTQSNTFTVVVPMQAGNTTNMTFNSTENDTVGENTTDVSDAGIQSPEPVPTASLSCDDPDPNKRPLGCLQESAEYYFQPQSILIEDLDRNAAARITPIGNLLITGDVVERSTGSPQGRAFSVTRGANLGEMEAVAWIDRETGDFHLRGRLHEEQLDIKPTKGSYVIQNAQSITVAYIDRGNGDLYIRGNLIPYRRSLEVN